MAGALMSKNFLSKRRCDKCHNPFNRLYVGVQVGPFTYNFHSTSEVIEAQNNYKEKLQNGLQPAQSSPLTRSETDGTVFEDADVDYDE